MHKLIVDGCSRPTNSCYSVTVDSKGVSFWLYM